MVLLNLAGKDDLDWAAAIDFGLSRDSKFWDRRPVGFTGWIRCKKNLQFIFVLLTFNMEFSQQCYFMARKI